ncbi:MAG: GAF domain-containing protein [Bdellovibrionales bacterium]|nr:GAF domain-containing protein [Bdellovibrionales bacterium]
MIYDPQLTKQHLKSVIFRSYIIYIKRYYPNIDIEEICKKAGLSIEYLLDQDNWVSVTFEERLMKEIRSAIDDPSLLRKVGAFGVQKEVVGNAIHFLSTKVFTLDSVYENIALVTGLLNKVMRIDIQAQEPGHVVFRISPILDNLTQPEREILLKRIPDFIENSAGYYSAIPTQKKLPPANVEIQSYSVDDIDNYYFEIHYQSEKTFFSEALPYLFIPIWICSWLAFNQILNASLLSIALATSITLFFQITRMFLQLRIGTALSSQTQDTLARLDKQYKSLNDTRVSLDRRLAESVALNHLVNILVQSKTEHEMLSNTAKSLVDNLGYDRSILLLSEKNGTQLEYKNSFGLDEEFLNFAKTFTLDIDITSDDPHKLSNVFRMGTPILISNVKKHLNSLEDEQSRFLLKRSSSTSFIAVPIRTALNNYGILISDCYKSNRQMTEQDLTLLTTVGRQLGIAIEKNEARQEVESSLEYSKKLSDSYSRFVPWETLSHLEYKSIFDVNLGDGVEKYMTILFTDIRGFTKICESMSPGETLKFLNTYYGKLSPLIEKHGGVIDKFIGDCIMAIYESPQGALASSLEIQRTLFNDNIERCSIGKKPIEAGIGICHGPVMIGPLGFAQRLEVTVLSDTVNIASRLDGLCKKLSSKILISGVEITNLRFNDNVHGFLHEEVQLRGKEEPVRVIEIVDFNLGLSLPASINVGAKKYVDRVRSELNRKKDRFKTAS